MTNPERILVTLDRHLNHPVTLVIYGRAAIALGFPGRVDPDLQSTLDVDVIIPESEVSALDADSAFWGALDACNQELAPESLYITHLFVEDQVILRPDWRAHCQPIHLPGLSYLHLLRPDIPDLVLTKMMRVDPQDRADVLFLAQQTNATRAEWAACFDRARLPDIPEIRDAFAQNRLWFFTTLPPAS